MPPLEVADELFLTEFLPAPEVGEWAQTVVIADTGILHNPDHQHLVEARIGYLWATAGYSKGGRMVLGQ